MPKKVFELDFEGKKLSVETAEIAKQADGAILVRLNVPRFYPPSAHRTNRKMRIFSR